MAKKEKKNAIKISDSEVRSNLDGHFFKGLQENIRKAYSITSAR